MKGIVFDLDNTLYDRYATIRAFMEAGYSRIKPFINPGYDFEKAYEHVCHTESLFVCDGWKPVYNHLLEEHFFNADNIPSYEKFHHFTLEGFYHYAIGFDGIHEFLDELKMRGYQLAILTNMANNTDLQHVKLELLDLKKYFDVIVISGEYSKLMCGDAENRLYAKPNPLVFQYTAEQLGMEPSDLYYVGDNPKNDVMGAYNSGYTPIWVRSRSPWLLENKYIPKICVDNVKEILDFLVK